MIRHLLPTQVLLIFKKPVREAVLLYEKLGDKEYDFYHTEVPKGDTKYSEMNNNGEQSNVKDHKTSQFKCMQKEVQILPNFYVILI